MLLRAAKDLSKGDEVTFEAGAINPTKQKKQVPKTSEELEGGGLQLRLDLFAVAGLGLFQGLGFRVLYNGDPTIQLP